MTKRIFIAATVQNDGKTTICLGLIEALKKRLKKIGFIKPVGQRYVQVGRFKIDEDSVLIEQLCGIDCSLKDMSPIAIEKGFTEWYIKHGKKHNLVKQIKDSFRRVAQDRDVVVIEGTGHAGVGSCFDLSNAEVARLLKSKAILISGGGIGRPIDEIMLNQALFERAGVELVGVIINKVLPEKYKKVNDIVRRGLERKGLKVLGVLPYKEILSTPTIREVQEELELKVLCGAEHFDNRVEKILVGAMEPHDAIKYLTNNTLIITPGDREDVITAIMSSHLLGGVAGWRISGVVLTGGLIPRKPIMNLLKQAHIPVLLAHADTYRIASRVHDLTIKIKPNDIDKKAAAVELVEKYIDMDRLVKILD